jgi:hypothetical protein
MPSGQRKFCPYRCHGVGHSLSESGNFRARVSLDLVINNNDWKKNAFGVFEIGVRANRPHHHLDVLDDRSSSDMEVADMLLSHLAEVYNDR